jgi:hypothetical protein
MRSGGTLATPIGEAGRIRSANKKFSRIFFYIRCGSPIDGARIAGAIAFGLHKENKRIGAASVSDQHPFFADLDPT